VQQLLLGTIWHVSFFLMRCPAKQQQP